MTKSNMQDPSRSRPDYNAAWSSRDRRGIGQLTIEFSRCTHGYNERCSVCGLYKKDPREEEDKAETLRKRYTARRYQKEQPSRFWKDMHQPMLSDL